MINEFRPHQARETLKLILEMQKKRRETNSAALKKTLDKCQAIINEANAFLLNDLWLYVFVKILPLKITLKWTVKSLFQT